MVDNNLNKIKVCAVIHSHVILKLSSISPKFVEICMETPCSFVPMLPTNIGTNMAAIK